MLKFCALKLVDQKFGPKLTVSESTSAIIRLTLSCAIIRLFGQLCHALGLTHPVLIPRFRRQGGRTLCGGGGIP